MEGGHVMITHRTSSHAVKGDFGEGKKERKKKRTQNANECRMDIWTGGKCTTGVHIVL